MSNIIEVNKLWSVFGDRVVHQDLDFFVPKGKVVALLGGSGAGKSVLLHHIAGLTSPTKGEVRLFGHSWANQSEKEEQAMRHRFSLMFQSGALFSALTVFENIAFPLRELHQFDEEMIEDLVYYKLQLVELEREHAALMPSELSGGMIKRVALARALILDPELLLLDEPTSGLDPERAELFVKLIKSLRESFGQTVLLVTHDIDTMYGLADSVAVLADKRIIINCPIGEFASIDHPFVRSFLQARKEREKEETADKAKAARKKQKENTEKINTEKIETGRNDHGKP